MTSRLQFERSDFALPFQAVCLVALAGVLGALVTVSPFLAAAVAAFALAIGLLTLEERLVKLFLVALSFGLFGYMFFDRGFAYAGLPPLYVGEALLGLAFVTLLYTFSPRKLSFLHVVMIIFMFWGLLRTLPYVPEYGIDALRDAVVWGYAIFALAISSVISVRFLERVASVYARLIPFFLFWTPILAFFSLLEVIPAWPQSGIAIAIFEPGDTAVHLAGMVAFVLSGMYFAHASANRLPASVFWALAIVCFAFVAATNRAGLLTIFAGIGASFFLWPSRQIVSFLSVATVVAVLVIVINPSIPVGGVSREISPHQIIQNLESIIGSNENDGSAGLQDTKNWRERWWDKVWDYTIHGPYFFQGKGFGINLADDDGFQSFSDSASRSPHNGHVTVLARMGVPGLVLWILFQALFGAAMYRAFVRARELASPFWAQVDICILVYWMAMLINMSFDVYLEGPQGGIWFWTIIGVGLGALRLQAETVDKPDVVTAPRLVESESPQAIA